MMKRKTCKSRGQRNVTRHIVRLGVILAAMFCLTGASGCQLMQKVGCWSPPKPRPQVVLAQNASLDDVMRAVNNNNAQKRTFVATDTRISIEGEPISLNGNLAYEAPKKFRAIGETVLSKEFDIGSNDELFWVWFKRDPQKAMYFSQHNRYESSPVRDSFQIDPYWLIESLGMTVFQPSPYERHTLIGATAEGNWKIETKRESPLGTYTKYTVVDGRNACVLLQELYNPSGRLVASAASPSHAVDPTTNITYPETVDMIFSMQGQKLGLHISMGRVLFNPSNPFQANTFEIPNYPDTKMVDITAQSGSLPIQQVSGTIPTTTY